MTEWCSIQILKDLLSYEKKMPMVYITYDYFILVQPSFLQREFKLFTLAKRSGSKTRVKMKLFLL